MSNHIAFRLVMFLLLKTKTYVNKTGKKSYWVQKLAPLVFMEYWVGLRHNNW